MNNLEHNSPDSFKKRLLLTNLFPSLIACILVFIYLKLKIGYIDNFRQVLVSIVLSLFAINVIEFSIVILRKHSHINKAGLFTFIFILLLFVAGYINNPILNIILTIFAVISFIPIIVYLFYYMSNGNIFYTVIVSLIMTLFGVFMAAVIWGGNYHNILYLEKIALGKFHIDTVFHSSIMNMIKTYGIPSTGLDGVVPLQYHIGSHYLFAMISNIINCDALFFYNVVYPILFIPLFIKSFFIFTFNIIDRFYSDKKRNIVVMLMLLIAGFAGILPKLILNKSALRWDSILRSESYLISLILTFLFLSISVVIYDNIILRKKNLFYYISILIVFPILLFCIGISKISLLIIMIPVILWVFIRLKMYTDFINIVALLINLLTAYFTYKLWILADEKVFELFSFIRRYTSVNPVIFLLMYCFGSILYLYIRKKTTMVSLKEVVLKKSFLDCEILLIFVSVGLLPGLVLKIGGGSAGYFSDFQIWFSLSLLIAMSFKLESLIKFQVDKNTMVISRSSLRFSQIYLFLLALALFFSIYNINNEIFALNHTSSNLKQSIIEKVGVISLKDSIKKSLQQKSLPLLIKAMSVKRDGMLNLPSYSLLMTIKNYTDAFNLKQKSNLYIYIERNNPYWSLLEAKSIPFLIPALTGIALIDGLPYKNEKPYLGYGYDFYQLKDKDENIKESIDDVLQMIKSKGVKNLIYIDSNSNITMIEN